MLGNGSLPAVVGRGMQSWSVPVCSLDESTALWVDEKEIGYQPVQLLRSLASALALDETSCAFPSAPGKLAPKLESLVLFHELHVGLGTTEMLEKLYAIVDGIVFSRALH